jgi:uncharacterized RDD family membrane protein YckC
MIDAVDVAVVLVMVLGLTISLCSVMPDGEAALPHVLFWTGVVVSFLYFVLLKRSSFRTPGYKLGHVRIVTLQGERPSIAALTLRTLFMFIGPLNLVVDFMWLPGDRHRQALRDKFAHTYVVRHRAVAAGHGPIAYATYTIMGYGFLFPEVREPKRHDP